MVKLPSSRYLQWIPAAVLVAIIITLIVLYSLVVKKNTLLEQSAAEYRITIHNLQTQIQALEKTVTHLTENLEHMQDIHENSENELKELIGMEWESKYETAKLENELLTEENTDLKNQSTIDIARLKRAQNFLSNENIILKKSVTEQKELDDKYNQLIAELEAEIKKHKKTIAQLEKPPEKLPAPAPAPEIITSRNIENNKVTLSDKNNKSEVYRHVRLQSLSNAMVNQDSSVRKKILVSVIPTIPDGVSGSELLSLLKDMQSEDILAVIQLTNKYIIRPLDNQTVNTLAGIMNEKDAETANQIFLNTE